MKSAWVITQEGPRHSTEVIGILSARKSAKKSKAHLEWFYALLHSSPHAHLNFARYNDPEVPYEAEYGTTNTGIPVGSLVRCGDNPYLVARLAKNVSLVDVSEDVSVLKWTEPDRLICDTQTPPNVEKIPGAICEAPIHLPLRGPSSEDTALKIAERDGEAVKIADSPLPPIPLEQLLQELEGRRSRSIRPCEAAQTGYRGSVRKLRRGHSQ